MVKMGAKNTENFKVNERRKERKVFGKFVNFVFLGILGVCVCGLKRLSFW